MGHLWPIHLILHLVALDLSLSVHWQNLPFIIYIEVIISQNLSILPKGKHFSMWNILFNWNFYLSIINCVNVFQVSLFIKKLTEKMIQDMDTRLWHFFSFNTTIPKLVFMIYLSCGLAGQNSLPFCAWTVYRAGLARCGMNPRSSRQGDKTVVLMVFN